MGVTYCHFMASIQTHPMCNMSPTMIAFMAPYVHIVYEHMPVGASYTYIYMESGILYLEINLFLNLF